MLLRGHTSSQTKSVFYFLSVVETKSSRYIGLFTRLLCMLTARLEPSLSAQFEPYIWSHGAARRWAARAHTHACCSRLSRPATWAVAPSRRRGRSWRWAGSRGARRPGRLPPCAHSRPRSRRAQWPATPPAPGSDRLHQLSAGIVLRFWYSPSIMVHTNPLLPWWHCACPQPLCMWTRHRRDLRSLPRLNLD